MSAAIDLSRPVELLKGIRGSGETIRLCEEQADGTIYLVTESPHGFYQSITLDDHGCAPTYGDQVIRNPPKVRYQAIYSLKEGGDPTGYIRDEKFNYHKPEAIAHIVYEDGVAVRVEPVE